MDLSNYFSIPGKSGLFEMLSQTKNGAVMESIVDGKRLPVFASDKISSLEEIGMFTTGEDIPLKTVFQNMFRKEDGKEASISPKADTKALQAYFSEVLPEWDKDRVYPSDIKKAVAWYNILLNKNLISLEEETTPNEEN
jgi:hypothetical protein